MADIQFPDHNLCIHLVPRCRRILPGNPRKLGWLEWTTSIDAAKHRIAT